MSADATLGVTLEPLDEPARLPTGSWVQDQPELHPQPLWVERASELGFATLVHGPELHVWSRSVHHHK